VGRLRAFQPKNAGSTGASGGEAPEAAVGCRDTRRSAPHPHLHRRRADGSELSLAARQLRPSQGGLSDVLGRRYSKSSANSRASCSLSTDGPDPGSRLPATSGVNKRVTAPTNPAKISMYAGTMALPVPDTKA
jgi:hypothetical protein